MKKLLFAFAMVIGCSTYAQQTEKKVPEKVANAIMKRAIRFGNYHIKQWRIPQLKEGLAENSNSSGYFTF